MINIKDIAKIESLGFKMEDSIFPRAFSEEEVEGEGGWWENGFIKRKEGTVEGGKFALPGGFINTKTQKGQIWEDDHDLETPHEAAFRETKEETGLDLNMKDHGKMIRHVGVYEGGGRDPRDNAHSWSKSHAFSVTIPHQEHSQIAGADDASEAAWHSVHDLPKMAFDHSTILSHALENK